MLQISCADCDKKLFRYQKDGPGILKRLYIDRIIDYPTSALKLTCPKCMENLGIKVIYKKEKRPAYRLFAGAVSKGVIKGL